MGEWTPEDLFKYKPMELKPMNTNNPDFVLIDGIERALKFAGLSGEDIAFGPAEVLRDMGRNDLISNC